MAITRYVGFGEETTFGTAISATEYADPASVSLDTPGDQYIVYPGASGLDRLVVPGPYIPSGDIKLPLDDKIAGYYFKWALGSVETAGTDPDYTHTFSPGSNPTLPSFTARIGKDLFEHVFTGCVIDSLTIEMGDGIIETTLSVVASKDSKASLADPVTFGEGNIFAAHNVNAMIAGTEDITAKVEAFTLKISNNVDAESGKVAGSRFIQRVFKGDFLATCDLTLSFFDTTELERFWGSATGPVENSISEFSFTINIGPNLDFIFPRVVYTSIGQPVEGRGRIQQTATIRGLIDDTGNGPIQISLTNNVASY